MQNECELFFFVGSLCEHQQRQLGGTPAQVYIIGLFKTLTIKLFCRNSSLQDVLTSGMAWMVALSQRALSQHSVDASEIRLQVYSVEGST